MKRIWGYILGISAALIAYIFYLLRRNDSLMDQIAIDKAEKEIADLTHKQEILKNEADDAETYYRKVADGYILEQRSKGSDVRGSDQGSGSGDRDEEN